MQRINNPLLIPIIAIGFSVALAACATPSMHKVANSMINECDDSRDRLVSQTEALACGATLKEFQDVDANSDGFVDQNELLAMAPPR